MWSGQVSAQDAKSDYDQDAKSDYETKTATVVTTFADKADKYVDINSALFIELGPEFVFGEIDTGDTTANLSLTAYFATTLQFTRYANWFVNFSAIITDDDTRTLITNDNVDFANYLFDFGTVTLEYKTEKYRVFGGIFTPNFGIPDRYLGLGKFGDDLIEYVLYEQVGIGAGYSLSELWEGEHVLSASLYTDPDFDDDNDYQGDGTPSYTIALDGTLPWVSSSFRYHAAVSSGYDYDGLPGGLALSIGETDRQLTDDVTLQWLAEFAFIENFEQTNTDVTSLTVGGILRSQPYIVSASYSVSEGYEENNADQTSQLVAFSLGYRFHDYVTVTLGYRHRDINGSSDDTLALTFSNYYEF